MNGTELNAMRQIGRIIAEKREVLNFTQTQLAEKCNLQPSQIKAVENGDRNYTIATLLNIMEVLGISTILNLKFYDNEPVY